MKNILYMLGLVALPLFTDRPNIVLIMANDLGWGDVGYHGYDDVLTPNIDRIAREGVQFSQGYVSASVCGPSRAGLLTGVYQQRFGAGENASATGYPHHMKENHKMSGLPDSTVWGGPGNRNRAFAEGKRVKVAAFNANPPRGFGKV